MKQMASVDVERLRFLFENITLTFLDSVFFIQDLTNRVSGSKVQCMGMTTNWDDGSDRPLAFLDRQNVACHFHISWPVSDSGGRETIPIQKFATLTNAASLSCKMLQFTVHCLVVVEH